MPGRRDGRDPQYEVSRQERADQDMYREKKLAHKQKA